MDDHPHQPHRVKIMPKANRDIKYTWRATSTCSIRVDFHRACKLANAGEHVSPNPFCNYAKYGLRAPRS